jgi:hypothetical protein
VIVNYRLVSVLGSLKSQAKAQIFILTEDEGGSLANEVFEKKIFF